MVLNIANGLIILHHSTKLHAFMGKVKNAFRIIEKRCNHFKAFKCVKMHFTLQKLSHELLERI